MSDSDLKISCFKRYRTRSGDTVRIVSSFIRPARSAGEQDQLLFNAWFASYNGDVVHFEDGSGGILPFMTYMPNGDYADCDEDYEIHGLDIVKEISDDISIEIRKGDVWKRTGSDLYMYVVGVNKEDFFYYFTDTYTKADERGEGDWSIRSKISLSLAELQNNSVLIERRKSE